MDQLKSNVNHIGIYRHELDGLRAIAVIAVIINHFNKNLLESGYLGVDIFFVISGYVITSSLLSRSINGFRPFISSFYQRRIKRLLPALIAYIFPISLLIWIIDPIPRVALRTGLTSIFGLSNLYLFKSATDYFAISTELNPFTHTWSLAVEEQFYIVFPIIIWLCCSNKSTSEKRRNLFIILLTLSIPSFISFVFLYVNNQSAAYFLMPTRFWEIAFGSLTYIFLTEKSLLRDQIKKLNPSIIFISIFIVLFLPQSRGVSATILVVMLSCLLIICLRKKTKIFNLLTKNQILFIGKSSYSLYLWHWGVLSISKWTIGISWWTVPFQITLMILLTLISYKYIENPLRKFDLEKKGINIFRYSIFSTISLALIILGKDLIFSKYLLRARNRIAGDEKVFTNEINEHNALQKLAQVEKTDLNTQNCHIPSDISKAIVDCTTKNKNARNLIAMFGDSMSRSLITLGNIFYQTGEFNIINISYGAQIFPKIKYISKENDFMELINKPLSFGQADYYQHVLKELDKDQYFKKLVMITNDFNMYFYGRRDQPYTLTFYDQDDRIINTKEALTIWLKKLEDFVIMMNSKNVKVIILASMPSFPEGNSYNCYYKESLTNFLPINLNDCIDNVNARRKNIDGFPVETDLVSEGIKKIEQRNKNFLYFDPTDVLCKDKSECAVYQEKRFITTDGVHFSNSASIKLYDALMENLKQKNFI